MILKFFEILSSFKKSSRSLDRIYTVYIATTTSNETWNVKSIIKHQTWCLSNPTLHLQNIKWNTFKEMKIKRNEPKKIKTKILNCLTLPRFKNIFVLCISRWIYTSIYERPVPRKRERGWGVSSDIDRNIQNIRNERRYTAYMKWIGPRPNQSKLLS